MMKRFFAVAAVLLAACGTEPAPETSQLPPGGSNPPGGSPVGSIPINALAAGTNWVKVVLNATIVSEVQACNTANPDGCDPVPCTTATQATACADYGGRCPNNAFCTNSSASDTIFYVKEYAPSQATFPVPCNGGTYSAEIYGANSSASPFTVQETHKSSPFTMSVGCTPSAFTWASNTLTGTHPAWPTLAIPPIYAGLNFPPYDTFKVGVTNFGAPWGSWAAFYLLNGGGSPIYPTAGSFAAPATSPSLPFQFTGLVYLSKSRLLAGQTAGTDWVLRLPVVTVQPIPTGGVGIP